MDFYTAMKKYKGFAIEFETKEENLAFVKFCDEHGIKCRRCEQWGVREGDGGFTYYSSSKGFYNDADTIKFLGIPRVFYYKELFGNFQDDVEFI